MQTEVEIANAVLDQPQPESSETARRTHNEQILNKLEEFLTTLEAEFAKLAELQAQEEAFAAELRKAECEADELLRDQDSPEKDLVKKVLCVVRG
jgi:hypothetical protein